MNKTIVDHVSHSFFGDNKKLSVLNDISFQATDREVIVILGPSGSGKSTLLRIIAGLLNPSEGKVTVDGYTPDQACKKKWIGYAFQDPGLLEWRTVAQNITLPAEIGTITQNSKLSIENRLQELLELVKIKDFKNFSPQSISGGMKQRVALARALFFRPRLLLLDEPLGALDLLTRTHLMVELSRLFSQNESPTIMVTHSVEEAVFLATRLIVFSSIPAQIIETIDIDFVQPRTLELLERPEYQKIVSYCRHTIFSKWAKNEI